jgi:hypothetical protein
MDTALCPERLDMDQKLKQGCVATILNQEGLGRLGVLMNYLSPSTLKTARTIQLQLRHYKLCMLNLLAMY